MLRYSDLFSKAFSFFLPLFVISLCMCVRMGTLGIEVEYLWSKNGWTNSSASFSPKERSQPDGVSQYLSIHLSVERFASLTCSHDASVREIFTSHQAA